ncbi:MAG TPA: hemerythrin domain-containing protein [Rhodocyclaceae bacterium]|nr:hemerythrin domain-containing protein [Rhodocyclaceae bacterium]
MLNTFEWDRHYHTGIDEIDAQHRELVRILKGVIEAADGGGPAELARVGELLETLEHHAAGHFAEEEALMARHGCDARHIVAHTRQHELFVRHIRTARTEYLTAGGPADVLELLANFITGWLVFHVLGADRDMAGQIARIEAGQIPERRSIPEHDQEGGPTRILVDAMGRLYDLVAQRSLALASARDELAALNMQLEQRVAERTADLERALAEVERTREQLLQSEKMSAIGQLAAGVAHEINNPIGFVSSNLASLKQYVGKLLALVAELEARIDTLDPPAPFRDALRALKDAADFEFLQEDVGDLLAESSDGLERVKKIVQDMKTFSHVDKAEWEHADVHQILESTLNVVAHELKYKAEVVREYGDIPPIRCLPAQIGQVLMNILVNAAQAIERTPGRITLATRPLASGVELTIADNGKGMTPEVMRRIFDPFFTTKPVGKGTGLGMSISYEIVKRHAGELHVDSAPGQGARFTLLLPLDPTAQG